MEIGNTPRLAVMGYNRISRESNIVCNHPDCGTKAAIHIPDLGVYLCRKHSESLFPKETTAVPTFAHSRWDLLLGKTISNIKSLSTLKGGEYAGDNDRLANFRRNGATLGIPMEVCWSIYYNKHHDAIMQYIRDISTNTARTRAEPISGRVDDMIVYLLLLKAMIEERDGQNANS